MKYKGGWMHLRAEGREIKVEARNSCLEDGGWERLREPCVARAQQVMSVCCGSPASSCLESHTRGISPAGAPREQKKLKGVRSPALSCLESGQ